MEIVSLFQLLAVAGLCFERVVSRIQRSRCVRIHSKCCCIDLDLERKVDDSVEPSPKP